MLEITEHPNAAMAILAIADELPPIDKEGKMELGGKTLNFTRIEDVRHALYPILRRHGIIINPRFVEQDTIIHMAEPAWTMGSPTVEPKPVRDGRLPSTRLRVQVVYDWELIHAPSGTSVVARTIGEAMDTSADKATGKATTAAIKRVMLEVFQVVDHTEVDIESVNPDDANRAVTTDRREGGDRGNQARQKAATATAAKPTRSITTNPRSAVSAAAAAEEAGANPATGEVPDEGAPLPEPNAAPEPSKLDVQKARIREAVGKLGLAQPEVDAIATEVTGKALRSEWIILPTALKKLADELEKRVAGAGE